MNNRALSKSNIIKRLTGETVFETFNYMVLFVLGVITVYPFLNIISLSFTSDNVFIVGMQSSLIPKEFSLGAYQKVFSSHFIVSGYFMTIARTLLGTLLTVAATFPLAYALSKKYFPHRTFWTMVIVFTMIFNGGLIPTYLLVKKLGLINSILALVLPNLINTFNLIIVRNYLFTIPESLEESARIDGGNDLQILFKIILPLSMPIVATISLWTAVGHWNAWFDSLIYTNKTNLLVLQVVLRRILMEGTNSMIQSTAAQQDTYTTNPDTIKAATIMVTTFPILLVYPFVQKYFIKGILIGSLKG